MNNTLKPLSHDGRDPRAGNGPNVGRRTFVKGAMAGFGQIEHELPIPKGTLDSHL